MNLDIKEYEKLLLELKEKNWLLKPDSSSNHIDSQKETWKYYSVIYNLHIDTSRGGKKKIKPDYIKEKMFFNGDTDFSFNKFNKKYKTLLSKIETLDFKDKDKILKQKQVIEKLNLCGELHHSLVNMSIMPILYDKTKKSSTLNRKKNIYRFDKYIRTIADYYESDRKYESVFGWNISETSSNFKGFFDETGKIVNPTEKSINVYCKRIYGINSEIVEELLNTNLAKYDFYSTGYWNNNENAYKHLCLMEDYMDLAYKYWEYRKNKYIDIPNLM